MPWVIRGYGLRGVNFGVNLGFVAAKSVCYESVCYEGVCACSATRDMGYEGFDCIHHVVPHRDIFGMGCSEVR
jgi:hypothetical protein